MAEFFVAIETKRKQPLGTLIRCSVAFGASGLYIIGSSDISTHGSHGAARHLQISHFFYWQELIDKIREEYQVVGISPTSQVNGISSEMVFPLDRVSLSKKVCFIVGKEREGLSQEQISLCNAVVYIPCPIQSLENLVHIDAKISLCFQRFATVNNLNKTMFEGSKHIISSEGRSIDEAAQSFSHALSLRPARILKSVSNTSNENSDEVLDRFDIFS